MIVRDTDARFVIDPVSGEITNNSEKDSITQGSHNSEVFTFELPRDIGHDMMNCNLIEVHYINIKAKDKTQTSEGIYKVNDLQVCPEDDRKVILSWTIDGSATVHQGTLSFSIHFKCISDDGKCLYRWPTKTFNKMGVTSCVDTTDAVMEENQDIIAEWEARISTLEQNCGGMINVKGFGAIGDGVTDDTDAIRNARNAAVSSNKALYFPVGTYMIHGSIELWSGCEIYGEGSKSIIKKIPAITQSVSKPSNGFSVGQTTFTVADSTGYTVGHECCVCLDVANYELIVFGEITNISNNNITITPHQSAGLTESVQKSFNSSTHSGKTLFSSSFPMFRSAAYKWGGISGYPAMKNVYIHDLTIDGNRQVEEKDTDGVVTTIGEPHVYTLSAVHFGSRPYDDKDPDDYRNVSDPHKNIRLENLNIFNSPSDGISIQSGKNVYITNCISYNCGFNGVHLGVGTDNTSVVGCKLNADYCGYFDCAGVGQVSLTGNHFDGCRYGIGGLDPETHGLTVTGNTFRGCSVGVCAGLQPFPEYMSHLNTSAYMFGHFSQAASGVTICNNAFCGNTESKTSATRTGVGISSIGGLSFVFSGNSFRNLDKAFEIGCAKYIRIADNFIRDCNTPLSMIDAPNANIKNACGENTICSAFTGNMIQSKAAGTSAKITIRKANNMLVTGNIAIGSDANFEISSDATNVTSENNIATSYS